MKRTEPLTGIVPPLVTPLAGRDVLDVGGLERLVGRLLASGVSGLFVLGTTGEGPALSYRLRREVVTRVCALAGGRVPVLVGITDTAFVEAVALAAHAADAGAAAVVAAPPYYLPPSQPELLEFFLLLLGEMPLPLYLYNMPALTKVAFEVETVRALLEEPRVHGIKDSSGNMMYFHRLLRLLADRPDCALLMGPEELLGDAVLAGAHGGVCGGANLFPELYVALHAAARAGDVPRTRTLQERVLRISESLYRVSPHPSAVIAGIKGALACLGVCDDLMAEPSRRFGAEDRRRVAELVETLRADVAAALAPVRRPAPAPVAERIVSVSPA